MKFYSNINEDNFNNLQHILEEYAAEFAALYTSTLEDEGFKVTGKLINSITTNVKKGDTYYLVTFSAADYWKFVENGRKAGKMPPITPIMEWIEAKKILPRPNANGKLPTTKQLAFMIARSIGENGTIKRFNYDGSHIVAKTVEELNEKYEPLIEKALADDFEHYVLEVFDKVVIEKLNGIFTGKIALK